MKNDSQHDREKQARNKVMEYLADSSNYQDILTALEICDGHTIFDPADFHMLPEFVRDHFSNVNLGEETGKNAIYLDDNTVTTELFGIYGLNILEAAARAHNVTSPKNGRGFRAQDLKEKLQEKLAA